MKQPSAAQIEFPMASMADLAFLLIIFFMITSVLSSDRGLDFEIPEPPSGAPTPAMVLGVFEHGFSLDHIPYDHDDQLLQGLVEALQRDGLRPIVLVTQENAAYQQLIDAIDAVERAENLCRKGTSLSLHIATAEERILYQNL